MIWNFNFVNCTAYVEELKILMVSLYDINDNLYIKDKKCQFKLSNSLFFSQ